MTGHRTGLRLLVGSYTATSGGHATGISFVDDSGDHPGDSEHHDDGDDVARGGHDDVVRTIAVVDDPSFIAVDADAVYAVSETDDGGVHAFRRDGVELRHLWSTRSGGDAPCHVRVDPSGVLLVANYLSGTVGVVTTTGGDPAVAAMPPVTGPVEDRQDGPHAHQSIGVPPDAGLRGDVIVSDLGGDALHEYRFGADGLEPVAVHHLDSGTGPRHMAWHDGDLFVSGELDGRVHRLRVTDGVLGPVESAATSEPAAAGDDSAIADAATVTGSTGQSYLSHLEVTRAGLVYVAVRGRDTIAVLDATGPLRLVAEVDCGGAWPRHFALTTGTDGPVVVVANERSDTLTVLPLGPDGVPGAPTATIAVGSPTCVVPL
ncbi:lactonase family protein [Curtobacterium sp. RRHDQ10]|uniref:lactonase family protein n=1 Tax=Curtobacterium phyllosphaerae TaxID=3413379 RepID=UPI003BF021DE